MADSKLLDLPSAGNLDGTEAVYGVQTGNDVKILTSQFLSYLSGVGGFLSGTGAAGQVSYWTGTNTQAGTDNLTWDNAAQVFKVTNNNLGTTNSTAVYVQNATPAAAGAQQISPSFVLEGQGRATTPNNSQSVAIVQYVLPSQGTTAPTGTYFIKSQINGGALGDMVNISATGLVTSNLAFVGGNNGSTTTAFGTINTHNFVSIASNQVASTAAATPRYMFAGNAVGTMFRTAFAGTNATLVAVNGYNYSNVVIGTAPFLTAPAGNTPFAANLAVTAIGTVTGTGTITKSTALYVGAPSASGSSNYSAYIDGLTNIVATGENLRLSYDDTNYASLTVSSGGNLSISTTNNQINLGATVVFGNDFRNTSTTNNARLNLSTAGLIATRNVADSNVAFIVNQANASSTGSIQQWQFNSVGVADLGVAGTLFTSTGVANRSNTNNAYVNVSSTGTVISRNVADANAALIISQANASSTGNILTLQNSGGTVASVSQAGVINGNALNVTNGFTQTGANYNIYIPSAFNPFAAGTSYSFTGSSTQYIRTGFYGNGAATLSTGANFGAVVFASTVISTFTSGAHPWVANAVVKAPGTIAINGTATVTNTAALVVDGASTQGTNNYGLYARGVSGFEGGIRMPFRAISGVLTTDTATLTTDWTISWQSAAATKTQNIPAAAATNAGQVLNICDGNGTASVGNPIVITPASGTINGSATFSITTARMAYTIQSDGAGNWVVI